MTTRGKTADQHFIGLWVHTHLRDWLQKIAQDNGWSLSGAVRYQLLAGRFDDAFHRCGCQSCRREGRCCCAAPSPSDRIPCKKCPFSCPFTRNQQRSRL